MTGSRAPLVKGKPPIRGRGTLSSAWDTGISNTDNITSHTNPQFKGTAQVGSFVEVFAGEKSLGTTRSDANDAWTFMVPESVSLSEGYHSITATVSKENVSLQTSKASPALNLTVDASSPVFSSTAAADPIDEKTGADQVIYTAQAIDDLPIDFSLKTANNDDSDAKEICILNAALSVMLYKDIELTDSIAQCRESLSDYKVRDKFNQYIDFTNQV